MKVYTGRNMKIEKEIKRQNDFTRTSDTRNSESHCFNKGKLRVQNDFVHETRQKSQ